MRATVFVCVRLRNETSEKEDESQERRESGVGGLEKESGGVDQLYSCVCARAFCGVCVFCVASG